MHIKLADELLTGNKIIDEQHKELFKRIDLAFQATKQGKGAQKTNEALTFLEFYMFEHFHNEEKLQFDYAFPEFEAHKKQHDTFKKEYYKLKEKINKETDDYSLVIQLLDLIVDWFSRHIKRMDKNVSAHIIKTNKIEQQAQ
ncbi:MAG: bacteriohemerythrin [candidate division Zixibacteria bacterium]|nr:bacteriohemerythrin [candidate division Zixibacteria bacterium]